MAFEIDRDLRNADWTKKSWDLPANSIEELQVYLELRQITPEHFKSLPVYRNNVDKPGFAWLKAL